MSREPTMTQLGFVKPRNVKTPPALESPKGIPIVNPQPKQPLTYTYSERREPHMGPTFLMAPWDEYSKLWDLNIAWHEAPDPIRQSPFFYAGNKIHPNAQMLARGGVAIGSIEAVQEDRFQIGKLLGYLKVPMYAGGQLPSVIRSNIREAEPITYGSMYAVQGVVPAGGVTNAGGMTQYPQSERDGYPY